MNVGATGTLTNFDVKALKYVAERRYGYIKELKQFGEPTISGMKYAGLLKTGWTKEEETFGVTDFLMRYVKLIFNDWNPKLCRRNHY